MSGEEVDSFAALFARPPEARRSRRLARKQAEKRAQMTDAQRARKRVAERTTQINFRCSPEFHFLAKELAEHLSRESAPAKVSIADIMEDALDMFARAKGYKQ